jgi:hypothetical protein
VQLVKVPGTKGRKLYQVLRWSDGGSKNGGFPSDTREESDPEKAHVVSSLGPDGKTHHPVLDIDVPAELIPSTTPGHSHLYLDVDMNWGQLQMLLAALHAAGIIERGYMDASIARGFTCVRLPWVKKPVPRTPDNPEMEP